MSHTTAPRTPSPSTSVEPATFPTPRTAPTPTSDNHTDEPSRPVVRFLRLDPRAILPAYKTEHAAGMDLAACLPEGESIVIPPGEIRMIPFGFAMALPPGYEAQVRPRSGLASRHAVTLPNAPGTIDADYRGQVMAPLINLGREPFTVEHSMRVAQMVIAPVSHARVLEVDRLDDTPRGRGGFGSTGL